MPDEPVGDDLNAMSDEERQQIEMMMAAQAGGPQGAEAQAAAAVKIAELEGVDRSEKAHAAGVERLAAARRDLGFLLDIPLEVTVVLGKSRMIVNDVLQLSQGSVVELNKLAGEPMEVFVNDKLLARGEVVVVNERFGVRLTDVISPAERVKSLGS